VKEVAMKRWSILVGVVILVSATVLWFRFHVPDVQPDPGQAGPPGWPSHALVEDLATVKGKTPAQTIRILGHPSKIEQRGDVVVWEYPWLASCKVTFRNGVVVDTFYTSGY
jgi:hypothetical protein